MVVEECLGARDRSAVKRTSTRGEVTPMNWLARSMLDQVDWSSLRINVGMATGVLGAIADLASAETIEDADLAAWQLDNACVVQGYLYQAAPFVVPVLLALLQAELPAPARIRVLDVLVEIGLGEPAPSEIQLGGDDLGERCRAAVREGLWTVYGLLLDPEPRNRRATILLLANVESDTARLRRVLEAITQNDVDPEIREYAAGMIPQL